ncbi:MAG: hypothetical protein IKJ68_12240, partial [Clostridia bacterium]|nr:hypothetical protein [Clostridia bacterium]
MINIKTETAKDKVRLKKCLSLRKYAPGLSDEIIAEIYEYLKDDKSKIVLSPEMLCFLDYKDTIKKARVIAHDVDVFRYDRIELTNYGCYVQQMEDMRSANFANRRRSAGGGGCTSCSGCSSNNNNNNN